MHLHNYSYLRLDGSSSIQDRRDMVQTTELELALVQRPISAPCVQVAAFQSDPDILCFLLSTRAGGRLGGEPSMIVRMVDHNSLRHCRLRHQPHGRGHCRLLRQ